MNNNLKSLNTKQSATFIVGNVGPGGVKPVNEISNFYLNEHSF